MHYAALNDSAQLVETIFLHAKANPTPMKPTSDFVSLSDINEVEGIGTIDEKFHDMDQ